MKTFIVVLALVLVVLGALFLALSQRPGFFDEAQRQSDAWRRAAEAPLGYDAYEQVRKIRQLYDEYQETFERLATRHSALLGRGFALLAAGIVFGGLGLWALRSRVPGSPLRDALSLTALALGCLSAGAAAASLMWMPDWAEVEEAVHRDLAASLAHPSGPATTPSYDSASMARQEWANLKDKVKDDLVWGRRTIIQGAIQGLATPALLTGFLGLVVGAVGYVRRWGALSSYATGTAFFGLATALCGGFVSIGELPGLLVIGLAVVFAGVAFVLGRGRKPAAHAPA